MSRFAARISAGLGLAVGLGACSRAEYAAPVAVAVDIPMPSAEEAEADTAEEEEAAAALPELDGAGRWEGRGRQDDGQRWDILLEVWGAERQPCATVEYPPDDQRGVSCRADWHCDAATSTPQQLRGVERIVDGHGACIDGCQVDADLRRGFIAFDCSHANVMATANVRRVSRRAAAPTPAP